MERLGMVGVERKGALDGFVLEIPPFFDAGM